VSKRPRWELCRSNDRQWFVRFIAANGQKIVTSETYKRKRDALHSIELVYGSKLVVGYIHRTGRVYALAIHAGGLCYLELRDRTKDTP
jgi:uncharacterized protein YegP (UPF0339 family)